MTCPHCAAINEEENAFCRNCNYPFSGTEKEQYRFMDHQIDVKYELETASKRIFTAEVTLYIIGAFTILALLTRLTRLENIDIIISLVLGMIFIGLGIFSRFKPFVALTVALFLYISLFILDIIYVPEEITLIVFVRFVIMGILASGIYYAHKGDKLSRKNGYKKTGEKTAVSTTVLDNF